MAQTGIALRIYGGSQTGGLNKAPLVSVGSLQNPFLPQSPTLVDEEQCWMITHAQDYTAYALHTKAYATQEGLPGQLLICLLLPADQRLDSQGINKDTLTLLNRILDLFASKEVVGGKLPAAPVESSNYANLLSQCKLTDLARPFPVMKGNTAAAFQPQNEAQLAAIMRYSNYPVLTNIARLEIGMGCQSTINIPMGGNQAPKPSYQKPGNSPKVEKPKETVQHSDATKMFDEDWIPDANPNPKEPLGDGGKKKVWPKVIIGTVAAVGLLALLWFLTPFGEKRDAPAEENLAAITDPTPQDNEEEDETRLKEAKEKAAEEQRKAEEAKKAAAEEQRKAEDAKKSATEEQKKAEDAKKLAAEELRKAEDAKKKAEEQRKPTVTSFVYDGIEYKYAQPTTSQLQEWSKKYHSVCANKIRKGDFDIPREMMEKHPCLVYLVLSSKSMAEPKEKQSWFDLYSLMNTEQINKLYDILYREKYKLAEIDYRYKNK